MIGSMGTRFLGVVLGVATAAGCGRVAFEPLEDSRPADPDVTSLDTTRCDELSGVLFCEDFEGMPQLPTVQVTPPSFVVTDDGTRAYRGARALHARTTQASEPAWILGAAMPYLMSGELHVRWYMYLPAEPNPVHIAPVHLVESSVPFHGVVFGVDTTTFRVTLSEPVMTAVSVTAVPRTRWVCFQLRIVISDTAGSVDVSVDGVPGLTLENIDTLPPNGYRNIHAGSYATSASTNASDVWTDELVASTSSIPCD